MDTPPNDKPRILVPGNGAEAPDKPKPPRKDADYYEALPLKEALQKVKNYVKSGTTNWKTIAPTYHGKAVAMFTSVEFWNVIAGKEAVFAYIFTKYPDLVKEAVEELNNARQQTKQ